MLSRSTCGQGRDPGGDRRTALRGSAGGVGTPQRRWSGQPISPDPTVPDCLGAAPRVLAAGQPACGFATPRLSDRRGPPFFGLGLRAIRALRSPRALLHHSAPFPGVRRMTRNSRKALRPIRLRSRRPLPQRRPTCLVRRRHIAPGRRSSEGTGPRTFSTLPHQRPGSFGACVKMAASVGHPPGSLALCLRSKTPPPQGPLRPTHESASKVACTCVEATLTHRTQGQHSRSHLNVHPPKKARLE